MQIVSVVVFLKTSPFLGHTSAFEAIRWNLIFRITFRFFGYTVSTYKLFYYKCPALIRWRLCAIRYDWPNAAYALTLTMLLTFPRKAPSKSLRLLKKGNLIVSIENWEYILASQSGRYPNWIISLLKGAVFLWMVMQSDETGQRRPVLLIGLEPPHPKFQVSLATPSGKTFAKRKNCRTNSTETRLLEVTLVQTAVRTNPVIVENLLTMISVCSNRKWPALTENPKLRLFWAGTCPSLNCYMLLSMAHQW